MVSSDSSTGAIPVVRPFNFGRDPGGPDDKTLSLTIPKLDLEDVPVFDTLSEEKLRDGTVHIPATGYPWQEGANVYIAGHRIGYEGTRSAYVFFHLDQLEKGDEILLEDAAGKEYRYRVTESRRSSARRTSSVMNAVEDGVPPHPPDLHPARLRGAPDRPGRDGRRRGFSRRRSC